MSDLNPYKPTSYCASAEQNLSRRAAILAAVSSLVGTASAILGLVALIETIQIAADQSLDIEIVYGLVASVTFLAFGTAWIAGAWLLWRQRNRLAGSLNALALVICLPVLAFLIFK
jgi:Ca2+/Na+ antiporter